MISSMNLSTVKKSSNFNAEEFLIPTGDAPFEEQFLNLPVAQAESVVKPDSVANDFAGKSVILIAFGVNGSGYAKLPLPRFHSIEGALLSKYVMGRHGGATT